MWDRIRFKTKSIDDPRPLIFNPKYPSWCSGYGDDYAIIIMYLPVGENIYKYYDDAYDIDVELKEEIEFTDRFPKPDYYEE